MSTHSVGHSHSISGVDTGEGCAPSARSATAWSALSREHRMVPPSGLSGRRYWLLHIETRAHEGDAYRCVTLACSPRVLGGSRSRMHGRRALHCALLQRVSRTEGSRQTAFEALRLLRPTVGPLKHQASASPQCCLPGSSAPRLSRGRWQLRHGFGFTAFVHRALRRRRVASVPTAAGSFRGTPGRRDAGMRGPRRPSDVFSGEHFLREPANRSQRCCT